MKKFILGFAMILTISCGSFRSGTDTVEETMERIVDQPGTLIIVAGESMNPEYILKKEIDGQVVVLENKGDIDITDAEKKYEELKTLLMSELRTNKSITKCSKKDSMWIGEVGVRLTVEGAMSGNRGNILACYHKGNKVLIEPNYQVRTDLPIVQVRIGETYYEVISETAKKSYDNRVLQ